MVRQDNEVQRSLGRIEGKLDALSGLPERLDKIDERLRKVEVKAAFNGAMAGGMIAVGFELVKAKLSILFGGGGQ